MFSILWIIIVGAIIGSIAGAVVGRSKGGCITNIFAGLVGSYVGHLIFGNRGPMIAGMAILPSIVGAVIIVAVIALIFDRRK
jgi:uncharacterized membrane protein YeaQ/YmgE (transglycosylase-associated protein family)